MKRFLRMRHLIRQISALHEFLRLIANSAEVDGEYRTTIAIVFANGIRPLPIFAYFLRVFAGMKYFTFFFLLRNPGPRPGRGWEGAHVFAAPRVEPMTIS